MQTRSGLGRREAKLSFGSLRDEWRPGSVRLVERRHLARPRGELAQRARIRQQVEARDRSPSVRVYIMHH